MAPRARVSSYSPQRIVTPHARHAKKSGKAAFVKTQMAVMNWENVLVPMDWMIHNLSLGTPIATIEHAVVRCRNVPQLLQAMAAIEDRVVELLAETVRSVDGPVFIVSEYTTAYIELVSGLFFPRLTAALRNATTGIYVVGTPDTQLSALEMKQWKANVLRTAIVEKLCQVSGDTAEQLLARYTLGRIGVVALCANETDIAATSAIHSLAPHAVVKRVKVQATIYRQDYNGSPPTPLEQFHSRLETLTKFVKHAAAVNQPISVAL
ncbi:hypothetical protein PRIC1_004627 [Phytophthora ramorum]